jgi:hypothetical protein
MDNTAQSQLMSLNSGVWDSVTNSSTTNAFGTTVCNDWWSGYCQPIRYYPYQSTTYIDRKIRLKLSEVDTLRRACKGDEKLKEVLKKITPMIEVEVDL